MNNYSLAAFYCYGVFLMETEAFFKLNRNLFCNATHLHNTGGLSFRFVSFRSFYFNIGDMYQPTVVFQLVNFLSWN